MASLPRLYPQLSLHLTDRSLTPLISSSSPAARSSSPSPQPDALTRLASTALGVHDVASRLGLGSPQRVLVEYGARGPMLVQTFIDSPPTAAIAGPRPAMSASPTPASNPSHSNDAPSSISNPIISLSSPSPTQQLPYRSRSDGTAMETDAGAARPPERLGPVVNGFPAASSHDYDYAEDHERVGNDSVQYDREMTPLHESPTSDPPPMLLGIVLASSPAESATARRATARLERIGRQIQESWTAEVDWR